MRAVMDLGDVVVAEVDDSHAWVNHVELTGRISSEAEDVELPSGDVFVRFRIVIPRDKAALKDTPKTTVDTVDCLVKKKALATMVRKREIGDVVSLTGHIRRRFWRAGVGVASRVEIEVVTCVLA